MTISVSDANAILKEQYGQDGLGNVAYEENPTFAMIPKKRFRGKHFNYAVQYGYGSNASRTGATALNKVNTVQYQEFEIPTVADFDANSIEKKALEEVSDEGAFVDLLTNKVDSVVQSLSNRAGADVFGHRGAAIGQVGSVSGTTVTLADPSDVTNFEVGQEIRSSEDDGRTGSLQAGSATITAVDRSAGTLETDTDWTTQIAALDADDYLFVDGDFGLGRAGLADWVPDDTSGLSTAFYAASRDLDPSRLAGSRVTATGVPVSEAIRQGATVLGREEGKPDTALMSFDTWNDLVTERDQKTEHTRIGSQGMDATIGFEAVKIAGVRGMVSCVPDRSCPDDRIYLIKKDELVCLHSQEKPVMVEDGDGNVLSREGDSFGFDIRGQAFLNFFVKKPVNTCVIKR